MLHQLSYQANWEQVVIWVDYKPVDGEMDDDNTEISHAFEMRMRINEFDHRILATERQILSHQFVHQSKYPTVDYKWRKYP